MGMIWRRNGSTLNNELPLLYKVNASLLDKICWHFRHQSHDVYTIPCFKNWTGTQHFLQDCMCTHEDTDQHVHSHSLIRVFAEHSVGGQGSKSVFKLTAKTLISLRGCTGWSESSLGAHAILYEMLCPTQMNQRTTKPIKCHVRPAKTQASLDIRPMWSESSLSAWRKFGSLASYWAHREDWSDWAESQGDLSSLGARAILLVLSCAGAEVFMLKAKTEPIVWTICSLTVKTPDQTANIRRMSRTFSVCIG